MNKSIVKLSLISTLILAANNAVALPEDGDNKKEAQMLEEAMVIEAIDPATGLVIYVHCPTLPDCGDDYPPMAELDQDQQ